MARVKPLDPAIVDEWLAAWKSDPFSDAAVHHLRSLITDPLCMVVVTLGLGREPRSLVFRRMKRMLPVPPVPPKPKYQRSLRNMTEFASSFADIFDDFFFLAWAALDAAAAGAGCPERRRCVSNRGRRRRSVSGRNILRSRLGCFVR
jgi:hypothetical protein